MNIKCGSLLVVQLILNTIVICVFYVHLHGSDRVIAVNNLQWSLESATGSPPQKLRLGLERQRVGLPAVWEEARESDAHAATETLENANGEFATVNVTTTEGPAADKVHSKADHLLTDTGELERDPPAVVDKSNLYKYYPAGHQEATTAHHLLTDKPQQHHVTEDRAYLRQRLAERLKWRQQGSLTDAYWKQDPNSRHLLEEWNGILVQPRETDDATGVLSETIKNQMEKCSQALGVSSESLNRSSGNISIASTKVARFINTFKSMLPEDNHFLSKYKNPCWHMPYPRTLPVRHDHNNTFLKSPSQFICLPYFFVPGFMKSGTTTLFNALAHHPDIVPTRMKEPKWWHKLSLSEDLYRERMLYDIRRYFAYFLGPSHIISKLPSAVTLDASADTLHRSPYYIGSQDYCVLPVLLSQLLPETKFIVVMRNPVTRTYSHFLFACSQQYSWNTTKWPKEVQEDPAGLFHQQAVVSIQQFNSCLQSQSLFECTSIWRFYNRTVNQCGEVGFRLVNSLYYSYLARWLQIFPREQFLFLRTEDFNSKPDVVMRNITGFLGLSQMSLIEANELLTVSRNKQGLGSTNIKDETVKLLQEFFRPYNTMLSQLVGDRSFMWG